MLTSKMSTPLSVLTNPEIEILPDPIFARPLPTSDGHPVRSPVKSEKKLLLFVSPPTVMLYELMPPVLDSTFHK